MMERFDVLDERGRPLPLDLLPGRLALQGLPDAERIVGYRIRATGEERWAVVRASPVLDDDGAVRFAINVFSDVTERRRVEEGARFIAEAGAVLSESLDYERTLAQLAQLAVPRIADWCMVYMLGANGSIERLAIEHAGGAHHGVLERLGAYRWNLEAETGVPAVLRTGRSQLYPEATSRLVASDVEDFEPLAAELESLGIASWMCVPVSARGRTLGVISLLTAESGRRYSEHDLSLAEELARRAGLAVDNARLFDEAERSLALLDTLLASAPIGMAFFDTDLRYVRVNAALAEINGRPPAEHVGRTLAEVIPDLAPTLEPIYRRVLETGEPFAHHEITGMTPASPGAARHWLSSYYPVKTEQGETLGVGAVITEITERKRAEDERARLLEAEQGARAVAEAAQGRLHLLAEASRVLASSLDFETTLQNVTGLFVPGLAEWAGVYLLDERGAVSQLAVAHADESKAELVRTMWERYGAKAEADHLVTRAIRERKAQVSSAPAADALASVAVDAEHLELMRRLRLGAGIVVPILAGERVLGALTFVRASDREDFGEHDVELAEELGRRAGVAIDNARLYEEAEQRARAAEALEFVGDGVFLLDRDGIVRLWNPAAEAITGVPAATVEGRPADQAVPGWAELASRIPIVDALGDATGRPETLPFDLGSREVWLSISGVGFPEGTVFAFRDVTEERGVEQMKSDFVATVSH
ncbi:MAG: PAS domain-containing protein, partial [Gaiellaceae bacterium]